MNSISRNNQLLELLELSQCCWDHSCQFIISKVQCHQVRQITNFCRDPTFDLARGCINTFKRHRDSQMNLENDLLGDYLVSTISSRICTSSKKEENLTLRWSVYQSNSYSQRQDAGGISNCLDLLAHSQ